MKFTKWNMLNFMISSLVVSCTLLLARNQEARTFDAKSQMLCMSTAYLLSRAIYTAATLNVADALTQDPLSIDDLAMQLQCNTSSLYRLLRMLASHGIFYEISPGIFTSNDLGDCLKSNNPNSIKEMVLGEDTKRWNAVGALAEAVQKGKPGFDLLYGKSYFQHLMDDSEASARFDAHMSNLTSQEDVLLVEELVLESPKVIVDIGGGRGGFLAKVLQKYSQASGVLFDTQAVINEKDRLLLGATKERCATVIGSFFEELPTGGDVYVLKRVLHDWDDEACSIILSQCYKCLGNDGKLYIIEAVVPEGNVPHFSKDIDLFMMAIFPGKERTLDEFRRLLERQDLRIDAVYHTQAVVSIIQVSKVC